MLKIESKASSGSQWKLISSTSLGLRFRRNSRFQRFIPYLNVIGSYCFLFRRCCWCVYLRKKL